MYLVEVIEKYQFRVKALQFSDFEGVVASNKVYKGAQTCVEYLNGIYVYDFKFTRSQFEDFLCDLEDAIVSYFEAIVQCPDCDEGEVTTGPSCGNPAWNCCGGCYDVEPCDTCDGAAWIKA